MGEITSQVKEAFFNDQKSHLPPSLTPPHRNPSHQSMYSMKLDALNLFYKISIITLAQQLSKLMKVTSNSEEAFLFVGKYCNQGHFFLI